MRTRVSVTWANKTEKWTLGMAADELLCGICNQSLNDPHTMLCGHTFCLQPCLGPVDSKQSLVQCPICFIETYVTDLEPGTSVWSSRPEPPAVCMKCTESCPGPDVCDDHSKAVGRVLDSLATVKQKLTDFSLARTSLESLKTNLCTLKDNSTTYRKGLVNEVISVGRQLKCSAEYPLEKTKLLLVSTYTEGLSRLLKLQRNLLEIKKIRGGLLKAENDAPAKIRSAALKEWEQSTRKVLDRVEDFQKSVESCEGVGFKNLELAQNFESVQLQLQDLALVTSDSAVVCEQLASFTTKTQANHAGDRRVTEIRNQTPNTMEPLSREDQLENAKQTESCQTETSQQLQLPTSEKWWDLQIQETVFQSEKPLEMNVYGVSAASTATNLKSHFTPSDEGLDVDMSGKDSTRGPSEHASMSQTPAVDPDQIVIAEHIVCGDHMNVEEGCSSEVSDAYKERRTERDWHLNPNGIFIKLLPEGTTENDLFGRFSKFGFITEINILRDPSKSRTVGCGFVTFLEVDSVRRVLEAKPHLFDGKRIIIRVAREKRSEDVGSVDPLLSVSENYEKDLSHSEDVELNEDAPSFSSEKLTIFVGCLKPEVTEGNLTAYFSQFGKVEQAMIIKDWTTGNSRGFGFVTFADSRAFDRGVLKACHFLAGCRLSVKRSVDRVQSHSTRIQPPIQSQSPSEGGMDPKTIFVGDLPLIIEGQDLHEYFSKFGIITDAFVLKKTRGRLDSRRCGFVTFRDEDTVQKVFDAQPCRLGGNYISVSHARVKRSGGAKPHTKAHIPNQGTSIPTSKYTIFASRLKSTTTGVGLKRYFLDGARVDVKPARALPQRNYSPDDMRLFNPFE